MVEITLQLDPRNIPGIAEIDAARAAAVAFEALCDGRFGRVTRAIAFVDGEFVYIHCTPETL